jgi:hypothetical protein
MRGPASYVEVVTGGCEVPLEFKSPSPRYLRELFAVSNASRDLANTLGSNALPDDFPVAAITELCQSLESLPKGTAEGSIQILLQARNRLPSLRNKFFDFEDDAQAQTIDPDARPIEKRDGFVDTALVRLMAAIGSAIDQYQQEAADEVEPDVEIDQSVPAGVDFGVGYALTALKKVDNQSKAILSKLDDVFFAEGSAGDTAQRLLNDVSNQSHAGRSELLQEDPRPRLIDKLKVVGDKTLDALTHAGKWAPIGAELVGDVLVALGDWGKASWDDAIESLKIQMIESGKFLTKVSVAIRKAQASAATQRKDVKTPPFDLREVRDMIRRGEEPPQEWIPRITDLSFSDEKELVDISALSGLTSLKRLDLGGTSVSDLTPLSSLKVLRLLYLTRTQVRDASALSGLAALQVLDLTGTQVSDVSALSSLTALKGLYLSWTQVRDIGALGQLTALRTLNLWHSRVSDVTALTGLMALQSLDLSSTAINDVRALGGLTALRNLDLSNTSVRYVSALKGLTELESLRLYGARIKTVSALDDLVRKGLKIAQ